MYLFLDGALSATTIGSTAVAIYKHLQLKKAKLVVRAEAKTLDAWTKHIDEEAKVDYTRLVDRLKDLH